MSAPRKDMSIPRGPRPAGWVNPMKGRPTGKARPLAERFWEKVDKRGPDECWMWTGSVRAGSHGTDRGQGYGQIFTGYTPAGFPTSARVHRVSYELHYGPVPDGLVVDHACGNTRCVNPAHLRAVRQIDNCTVLAKPTPFLKNMLKTTCKRGHPFDSIEMRYGKPSRACSICKKLRPSYLKKLVSQQPPKDSPK